MTEAENAASALAWVRKQAKELAGDIDTTNVSDCIRIITAHLDGVIEKRLGESFITGQSAGLDEASNDLMSEAAGAFRRQNDSEAKLLRSIAINLKKKAEDRQIKAKGL